MKKIAFSVFGLILLADGLLTTFLGRRYVRLFRIGSRSNLYRRIIEKLIALPSWQIRSAEVTEAVLGIGVLCRTPPQLKALYRRIAWFYDSITPIWRVWLYGEAHRAFDQAVSLYLPQGGHVLDMGCGTGANLNTIVEKNLPFGSYTGVDLSEAMLAQARRKFGGLANIQFQQLDLMIDPLPEGPFDLILSTWVFEQIPDPLRVVRKAWDRLRDGGHILLLFSLKANSFQSLLWNSFISIARAKVVDEQVVRRFPGLVSFERYGGALGDLAIVILEKPS